MKRYKALLTLLMIAIIALVGATAYADFKLNNNDKTKKYTDISETTTVKKEKNTKQENTTKKEETTIAPVEEGKSTVTLVSVGDNLIHTPLLDEGLQPDGSYDFHFLFEIMQDDFRNADIAVINQESVIGGPELGYDGYPNFNSPNEVADCIEEVGFDVVLHASNHAMDVGVNGIKNSIAYWKNKESITMLGFNETAEEAYKAKYIERNGIKIAMFNFTYGLNGYSLPEGENYLVNLLDDYHKEQIINEIKEAKENSDFVIAFPHWGNEDWLKDVSDFQIQWANTLTDAGVDLIIGTHPHVLEKIEWINTEAGNKSLCYYSVGNYISNQQELNEVLGGMAKVTIVKENGETFIDETATGIVPTVTQNDRTGAKPLIQTYRLTDYTEEMAAIHDIKRRFDSSFSAARLNQTAVDVLGDWIIE